MEKSWRNWKEIYCSRVVSADEAVSHIKSGDRVVLGHSSAEPAVLSEAMARNCERYENVEVVHLINRGKCTYAQPGMEKHFWHNSMFVSARTREHVNSGRGDFTPIHFHEVPKLFRTVLPVDVAMIQVSEPDEYGYVSFGTSPDYGLPAARCAKLVLAEVNKQFPYTYGDTLMHVSEIDYFVESDRTLPAVPVIEVTETERKIGEYCASLVQDGATLQFGIGGIPQAMLDLLNDKKDLGIHSEALPPKIVDLLEAGVINNSQKGLNDGYCVATFVGGDSSFHRFVDKNPMIKLFPVDYVNDPRIIAQNRKMTAVNSCVQVDIMGQACSQMIGYRQYSGIGGQADFIRGAAMSEGGRSILAIKSTTKNDTISKIVPLLDEGCCVDVDRADIDFVVTEYGIAALKGVRLYERAKRLADIAHPKFRDELLEAAEKRFGPKYLNLGGVNN